LPDAEAKVVHLLSYWARNWQRWTRQQSCWTSVRNWILDCWTILWCVCTVERDNRFVII